MDNINTNEECSTQPQVNKTPNKFVHFVIAILIIAIGFGCALMLIKSKKKPPKKERPFLAPLVNTQVARSEDISITISGFGTVEPKTEVQIIPQVSGQVVQCHANLVNGGRFKANQPLMTIDQRDYIAAVNNAEATVATAKLALDQEQEEATIAKQEWQQLNPGKKPTSSLVFRSPQIEKAKAGLKSAQAQLETAKLNLDRTVISMPFNGRVSQESVDTGQYVTPGQSLGSVYGTDTMEIVVPLEDKDLAWFVVPDNKNQTGSTADVKANFAGQDWHWQGKVVRTEGNIDPVSRMVKVVVEVQNPFDTSNDKPALVPGMFVEIEIQGNLLKNVIRLPRHVVHNYDQVWIAKDGVLETRKVNIIRNDYEYSYITKNINDGDIIVTSPMDAVTNGMLIRTENAKNKTNHNGK